VNLWMKRAIGAAALGGGLLALSAGAASAQDVAADVSARLGRSTSAEVRVCADGRILSGLVGSCRGSGTSASANAGRANGTTGIRARVRVPGTAQADVSLGTRRRTASGQAAATPRSRSASADASAGTSPRARADASASLSRPAGRLLDLDATASLAGVGLLGSSPFTLVGDPATDNLLPTGELTLDDLTGETPAGIGVLDTGLIASGNQAGVNVGDVSPSVPVTVCGNAVGVLGDTSASCGTSQPAGTSGSSPGSSGSGASAGTGDSNSGSLLDGTASGNQVDAGIGSISPSVPVTVCGNSVGALGDASASCGTGQPASSDGGSSAGTSGSTQTSGTLAGNQAAVNVDDVSATVPVTVSCNSVGVLGDASSDCGTSSDPNPGATDSITDIDLSIGASGIDAGTGTNPNTGIDTGIGVDVGVNTGTDTSTGGIIAPPGTTSPDRTGGDAPGLSTGTSGIPGTLGLTPGSGGADGSATGFALLRPSVAGSGALPFTGAASDLLALVAFGLLVAGAMVVRATRPAAQEGGDDR
jgi:hypothetical protein